jgi:diguanylate cyclase (GGDEF)-like protein
VKRLLLLVLLACSLPIRGQVASIQTIDRAEEVGWADPDRALHMLDGLDGKAMDAQTLEELLTVRGILLVDTRKNTQAEAVIARLLELGRQRASAARAAHIIRTYLYCQQDRLNEAVAELRWFEPDDASPGLPRYRLETLKGSVFRFTGQYEAAILAYERAIDIADEMQRRPRKVAAMLRLAWVLEQTGNLDGASRQLRSARELAVRDEDEAALAGIARSEADVADRRGDRAAERSACLEELTRAQKAGSTLLMALAFADLGDSYAKTGEFARSLEYSRQAAALAPRVERNGFEPTVRFNIALAEIGLGSLALGKSAAENALKYTIDSGNLVDADGMLREYGPALERAGDLKGALAAYHRVEALRDKLMSTARERAVLELSGKFEAERRTREIELLKKDNAIKDHDLRTRRLQQETVLVAAAVIALACAALAWAMRRIRKVNARLLFESQHDALTGLYNRRYFNEQILARSGNQPLRGCVLLIDLDHFKHINDTLGHPAGDAILAIIGKRLLSALREGDLLVRWGGEEFLALLGPMSDAELNEASQRVLQAIRDEPLHWNGTSLRCTVSIGCASFPVAGVPTQVTLERAISLVDKALYEAKRRGRNCACRLASATVATAQDLTHSEWRDIAQQDSILSTSFQAESI